MTYQDFAGYSDTNELTLAIARLRTQERISLDKGDSQAADDAKFALGRAQSRLAELYRERGLLNRSVSASATMTPAERAAKGWERVLANPFPPEPSKGDGRRKSKSKRTATVPAPRPHDPWRTLTYSTKRLAGVIRARKLAKQDEADLARLPTSALVFLPRGRQRSCTAADLEALGWSRHLIAELDAPTRGMKYRRTQILHRIDGDDFQRELARLYQSRLEETWREQRQRQHEWDVERLTHGQKRESKAARRWQVENARYREMLNTRTALEASAAPTGKGPDLTVTPIRSTPARATVETGRTGAVHKGVCPVCNKGGLPRGWLRHQRCEGMARPQETENPVPAWVEAGPAPEPHGSAEYRRLVAVVEQKEAAARGKRTAGSARPVRIPEARRAVLERCEGRCENPGCAGQPDDVADNNLALLEVDHVDEIADGGRDHPRVMVALCPNCHAVKTRGRTRAQLAKVLREVAERAHAAANGA